MNGTPYLLFFLLLFLSGQAGIGQSSPASTRNYQDLTSLFSDWRAFEEPPLRDGAPDYRLEAEAKTKTGPSGIGKDNYTWYLQKVHLAPLTWEDEVMLLKRELARAWSALKLEEHRNRGLPELVAADSPAAYTELAERSAKSLMAFLEQGETEKELLLFEQHLYLRQPGYGASYITGKYLVENALAEFARIKELKGEPFHIKDFFGRLNAMGNIPVALGHWEMTGDGGLIRDIVK